MAELCVMPGQKFELMALMDISLLHFPQLTAQFWMPMSPFR
jgi:hypothetical protein